MCLVFHQISLHYKHCTLCLSSNLTVQYTVFDKQHFCVKRLFVKSEYKAIKQRVNITGVAAAEVVLSRSYRGSQRVEKCVQKLPSHECCQYCSYDTVWRKYPCNLTSHRPNKTSNKRLETYIQSPKM